MCVTASLRKGLLCLAAQPPGMCLPPCEAGGGSPRLTPAVRQNDGKRDWLQTQLSHKFGEASGKSLDFSFLTCQVEWVP